MPFSLSGYGTTHKIREQLRFTDEIKWKQFSSRRLELIDKFELSKYKASEQDDNIKQIANMLRIEFEFPVEATQGFEKLVTAAVQSVRRNRKRSKKKSPSSSSSTSKRVRKPLTPTPSKTQAKRNRSDSVTSNSSDDGHASDSSSMSHSRASSATTSTAAASPHSTSASNNGTHITRVNTPSSIASPPSTISLPFHQSVLSPPNQNFQTAVQNILLPLPTSLKKSTLLSNNTDSNNMPPAQETQKTLTDDDVARSIMSDLIVLPVINNKEFVDLVKESHTCNTIINKQDSQANTGNSGNSGNSGPDGSTIFAVFANMEILGEMVLKSSVSFSVEKNFNDKFSKFASTKEYITLKTFQQESLTTFAKNLFNKFNINANTFKQNDSPFIVKLLFIIIGALVTDHGFEKTLAVLNPFLEDLTITLFTAPTPTPVAPPEQHQRSKSAVGLDILSTVSLQIDQESQQHNSQMTSNQNNLFAQSNGSQTIKLPQIPRRSQTPSNTLSLPIPAPAASIPSRSVSALTTQSKPDLSVIDNIINRIHQKNTTQNQQVSESNNGMKRHLFKDGNLPHPIAQSLS